MPIKESKLPKVPSVWPPTGSPAPKKLYVVERYRLHGSLQDKKRGRAIYSEVMELEGWKRICLADALTGDPKGELTIWEAPATPKKAKKPFDALDALNKLRDYLQIMTDFQRTILAPLPYDPATDKNDSRPEIQHQAKLLFVRANVKDGAMQRLVHLKKTWFKPLVEKELGWTMHSAGYVRSPASPNSTIMQCWILEEMQRLPEAMVRMNHEPDYGTFVAPCIVDEEQEFYSGIADKG